QFGDVFELPRLVEECLGRRVEAKDWEPPLARYGLDPVRLLLRLGRTKYDVERAVGIQRWFGVTADGGQRLAALQFGPAKGCVHDDRPEVLRRNTGQDVKLVGLGAIEVFALCVAISPKVL